jgi:hypothetical protein
MINAKSFDRIKVKIYDDERPIFKESGSPDNIRKSVNKFLKGKYKM